MAHEKDKEQIGRYLYALNHAPASTPLTDQERRIADAEMVEAIVPGLHYGTPFLALVISVDDSQEPTVRLDCTRCARNHTIDIKQVTLIVRSKAERGY
jgi:hypothetical protein